MPTVRRLAVASLLLVAAARSPLHAQIRTGTISGIVKDSGGRPIPMVEVTAIKLGRTTHSDSVGRFVIGELPSANTDFGFRRLAYAPVILMIAVPPSDTAEVEVILGVVAQQLTAVLVSEHPEQLRRLVAFETRRAHGVGHFITRDQIEDRRPLRLSDMLRSIPGTMVSSGDNGRTVLRFTRGAGSRCPPQYFLDGIQATGFSIDDISPADVEGVEIYAGSVGLPPEFNRLYGTSICGTVVIWSRIPGNRPPKP